MKRYITPIIIILCLAAAAIPASAQLRWGPSVGVSFNQMKFNQHLFDVKNGIGGSAGMRGEMIFPGIGFGLELGLYYQQRAAKLDLGQKLIWSSQGYGRENIFIHSIDIPFNLKFKWTRMQGLEDYVAPFVFGGPILSIQAGHSKCEALKYAGGEVLLTVGGGFEIYKRWQIAAQYTWGMTYALKTRMLTDVSARNRTLDIKLTYFLK
ncbi:MAG: PorT family protein [Muribaculaceae bacterium]|nr:PorT family protein [Muribaculaceae bacterium]